MLMSILLPGLSRSRELAKRMDCSSNLRQLTFAWNFYAMDNDGRLCPPTTGWDNQSWVADGPAWPGNCVGNTAAAVEDGTLWEYADKVMGIYKCKTDRSGFLRSYSLSCRMTGTLANIPRASAQMVFVDTASSWSWINDCFYPVKKNSSGSVQWIDWNSPDYAQQITARHAGGCNMSFADAHCERWRWKDRRTVKFAAQLLSADQASQDNSDIERLDKLLDGFLF